MDIHHIYTGRGESNFLIFPDATSMLVDAGDHDPAYEVFPYMTKPMPDKTRRAGEWIARYIMRVNPHKENVDYMMLSHFHGDHMGSIAHGELTSGRNPDYKLTGLAHVGGWIRFGMAYDRGYPDYNYPTKIGGAEVDNYRAFLKHHATTYGMKQEKFKVGMKDQISLKHNAEKYSNLFSIRNLAANGEVWTGEATRAFVTMTLTKKTFRADKTKTPKAWLSALIMDHSATTREATLRGASAMPRASK